MEAANDDFDAEEQMLLEDALENGAGESMGSGGVDVDEGQSSHIDTTTSTAAATGGGLRNEVLSVPERLRMRKEFPEWSQRRQAYIDKYNLFKPPTKSKLELALHWRLCMWKKTGCDKMNNMVRRDNTPHSHVARTSYFSFD
jgi:hypothetical protein